MKHSVKYPGKYPKGVVSEGLIVTLSNNWHSKDVNEPSPCKIVRVNRSSDGKVYSLEISKPLPGRDIKGSLSAHHASTLETRGDIKDLLERMNKVNDFRLPFGGWNFISPRSGGQDGFDSIEDVDSTEEKHEQADGDVSDYTDEDEDEELRQKVSQTKSRFMAFVGQYFGGGAPDVKTVDG